MNLARPSLKVVSYAFQLGLALRRLLPKQKCQTFSMKGTQKDAKIEKVYVINLDREPSRWSNLKQELRRILDSRGEELLNLTERYAAIDAKAF